MGNEAILVEKNHVFNSTDHTVLDSVNISKGTLMSGGQIGTGRSAVPSTINTANATFVGIANADKEANDGQLNVGLEMDGIWDIRATSGAAIAKGELVKMSGANMITGNTQPADLSNGRIVGTAEESTAAGTWEIIEVNIGRRV